MTMAKFISDEKNRARFLWCFAADYVEMLVFYKGLLLYSYPNITQPLSPLASLWYIKHRFYSARLAPVQWE